jgi:hypothetical protein
VSWPIDPHSGSRTTTSAGKAVWAKAAKGLASPEGDALAEALTNERNWRFKYDGYTTRLAELQSGASHDACVASCKAGLKALHDTFDFVRGDGEEEAMKLSAAMRKFVEPTLFTGTIRGDGVESNDKNVGDVAVAVAEDGGKATLTGDALVARVRQWADEGKVEPDVVEALKQLNANADKWAGTDLSNTVFVLLGGTSEMCPLAPLLARGGALQVESS